MKPIHLCSLGLAATCVAALLHYSAPHPAATAEMPTDTPLRDSVWEARPKVDPADLLDRIRVAMASDDPASVFSHLAALVRADPEAAARFAEANEDAATRGMILHRVARLWAERDASAALAWAAALTNAGERDALVTDVCLQLAESDPAAAVRTLSDHITGDKPHGGLEALAQRWAESDFQAARAWALSRPGDTRRDRIVARIAYQQAQDSPLEAATLAANEIPEGKTQAEAVLAVLHQWALRDLAAAEEWVEGFPEGDLQTRAVNEIEGIARFRSETHR